MDIDHVAIRVRDLDAAVGDFQRLGMRVTSREIAPDGATPVAYLQLGAYEFEVFEAPDVEPGLDHVGLRVADLDDAVASLNDDGVATIGDEVVGTRRSRAWLLDPVTTGEVRMHLCQREASA